MISTRGIIKCSVENLGMQLAGKPRVDITVVHPKPNLVFVKDLARSCIDLTGNISDPGPANLGRDYLAITSAEMKNDLDHHSAVATKVRNPEHQKCISKRRYGWSH